MSSWKLKKARRQIKEDDLPSGTPPQTGLTFNVWYNKWSQGGSSGNQRFVSPFRLNIKDSGRTNAEADAAFCLYFARGCCILGSKCQYLHHVPDNDDSNRHSSVKDCFGRDKFASYRDDMSGVGSFRKVNRTLYIGGLSNALNNKPLKPFQIESRLRYVFGNLGDIDRIRYVDSKNCAFVKYRNQINAEFAKEVMTNQTLLVPTDKEWESRRDGSGLLVKWANDDPDPEARRIEEDDANQKTINVMQDLATKYQKVQEENTMTPKRLLADKERSQFMNQALKRLKPQQGSTSKIISSPATSKSPKPGLVSNSYESSSDEGE